jgi:hypothetical protein
MRKAAVKRKVRTWTRTSMRVPIVAGTDAMANRSHLLIS